MKYFRHTAINLIGSKNYPKMNLGGIPKFSISETKDQLQITESSLFSIRRKEFITQYWVPCISPWRASKQSLDLCSQVKHSLEWYPTTHKTTVVEIPRQPSHTPQCLWRQGLNTQTSMPTRAEEPNTPDAVSARKINLRSCSCRLMFLNYSFWVLCGYISSVNLVLM